jgi:hypothetical protein
MATPVVISPEETTQLQDWQYIKRRLFYFNLSASIYDGTLIYFTEIPTIRRLF